MSSSWAARPPRSTRRAAPSSWATTAGSPRSSTTSCSPIPTTGTPATFQAAALEQLGYQAESGPWRNFYLTAAQELRGGVRPLPTPNTASPDTVRAMSTELFLDYLAVRLDGSRAGDRTITLALKMPDVDESWTLMVRNGALSHRRGAASEADATVVLDRSALDDVILGTAPIADQIAARTAKVQGDEQALHDFIALLDDFDFWFAIVTP